MAEKFEFNVEGKKQPESAAPSAAPASAPTRSQEEDVPQIGSEAYSAIAQEALAEHIDLAQVASAAAAYAQAIQSGQAQPDVGLVANLLVQLAAATAVNFSAVEADIDEVGQVGLGDALADAVDELTEIIDREILSPQVKKRLTALRDKCAEALGDEEGD